jgi:hypothetical protein
VVCCCSTKSTRKVSGVESDPSPGAIAKISARHLSGRKAKTDIFIGEAAPQDLSAATLAFMFNPLGADTLREVLKSLSGRSGFGVICVAPA